jgi:hypothetical protein
MNNDPKVNEIWQRRWQQDPAPDLHELIEKHGGYDRIPPEAWAQWDRLSEAWRRRHRMPVVLP